jgi:hemolysin D
MQPLEPATVAAIRVHEDDRVAAGDVLIELDATAASAEVAKATHELIQAQLDVARFDVLLRNSTEETIALIGAADASEMPRTLAQYQAQREELAAKLRQVEKAVSEKTADLTVADTLFQRARDSLPLVQEKAEIRRRVSEMQYGSRLAYLEAEQQLLDARSELEVQKNRVAAAAAVLEGLDRKKAEICGGLQNGRVNGSEPCLSRRERGA